MPALTALHVLSVCCLFCSQKRRRSSSSGLSAAAAAGDGNDSHNIDDTRVLRPSQEHLLQAVPAAKVTRLLTASLLDCLQHRY
jgi:hypothetical protein